MPRVARTAPADMVFHAFNRANDREPLFTGTGDYDAFERVMLRMAALVPMRLLASCLLMRTHWHLRLWPSGDADLGADMHRLITTHARRWRLFRRTVGVGHVYQGTFKSFPVQTDTHLLIVCRYVERNALRAGLVARAEDRPWSSAWIRAQRAGASGKPQLADLPIACPANWLDFANEPLTAAELEAVRVCVQRGRPYGGGRPARRWRTGSPKLDGLYTSYRLRY
jgi:putative transposase